VGQYVVDHCDVLIAVWDGQPSRGRGGTAEIVQYALEQNRPIIRVWGDSFEVLNRDNNNGLDASALDAIDQAQPGGESKAVHRRIVQRNNGDAVASRVIHCHLSTSIRCLRQPDSPGNSRKALIILLL